MMLPSSFKDETTEVQSNEVTCSKWHITKGQDQPSNPGNLALETMLSPLCRTAYGNLRLTSKHCVQHSFRAAFQPVTTVTITMI